MKKALLLISIFLLPTFLQACSDEDDNQRCQAITKMETNVNVMQKKEHLLLAT